MTIALRILRVEIEDEQILLVDVEIGPPEREAIGVALHDPRQAGRATTDHVEPGRGEMRDMARAEPADPEMRIVGEDWAAGRGARRRDRPGIAAGIGALGGYFRRVDRRRARPERQPAQAHDAQVGVRHRRDVEPGRHAHRPGRAQRRDDRIQIEQAERRELGAADLVVGIADRGAAREHEVADVPLQRCDAQDGVFQRQQRGIGGNLVDPRIDPGDIGTGTGQHVAGDATQLDVQVAAIVEQACDRVMLDEPGAERLRQPAEFAAVRQVDLEQPIARDDIALAEERIGDRGRANVRDAVDVVDDLDRCGLAVQRNRRGGRDRQPGLRQRQCRDRPVQE